MKAVRVLVLFVLTAVASAQPVVAPTSGTVVRRAERMQ